MNIPTVDRSRRAAWRRLFSCALAGLALAGGAAVLAQDEVRFITTPDHVTLAILSWPQSAQATT